MKKLYNVLLVLALTLTLQQGRAQSEATFYTTMGTFTVDLYDTLTPITVDSFIARCADKFYDGIIFHRVMDGFMIQAGGYTATGQKNAGYTIQDEFVASLSNVQQTISMANTGAVNSGSTQFFINLVNNTGLDYDKQPLTSKHPVFGKVSANFSIVQDIGKTPTTGASGTPPNKPLTDVVIDSIRITRFPADIQDYYAQNSSIDIYPNPATGSFHITIPANNTAVTVTGINGKVVYNATQQQGTATVDMSHQPRGIYLIHLQHDEGTAYGRVILQ